MKQLSRTILVALFSAAIGVTSYKYFTPIHSGLPGKAPNTVVDMQIVPTDLTSTPEQSTETPGFVSAAQKVVPAVVHIRATQSPKKQDSSRQVHPFDELFKEFFGDHGFGGISPHIQSQPRIAMGSGVLMSEDGYIITNNHVIAGADLLEVTLNDNRCYHAELIGQDPDTDLALLKIKESGLSYLQFGDSEAIQVGEWVLAVGNPHSLTSTVTKGIVSAKARSISQGNGRMKIESFIQTDAAVNSGSSGGALVDMSGKLIGINTAIAISTTTASSFIGYSFAIPSSIVRRVISDIKQYGVVQRAFLGITMHDMNDTLAKEKGLKRVTGVYVAKVINQSAASEAGLREGDIIVAINGKTINNMPQLQGQMILQRPTDKINITFVRKNKQKTVTVNLQNTTSTPRTVICRAGNVEHRGVLWTTVPENLCKKLKLQHGGVQIQQIKDGCWQKAGIRQGFILTEIDKIPISNTDTLAHVLNQKSGGILVKGVYPGGTEEYYYGIKLEDVNSGD